MQNKNKFDVRYLTKIGMLTAISIALMSLEFPLPLFPAFLKIDLSDLPALLGGLAMGPLAAVIIQLLKNLIHFVVKNDGTGGIGNLANFLVGVGLVVPAAIFYLKNKNMKRAILGMAIGIISMVVVGALANYFILLPLYGFTEGKEEFVLYTIVPFNAIKGVIVCIITAFIYKPLSGLLHK